MTANLNYLDDLRRHPVRRAYEGVSLLTRLGQLHGHAKVGKLDSTLLRHQYILGLRRESVEWGLEVDVWEGGVLFLGPGVPWAGRSSGRPPHGLRRIAGVSP